MRWQTASDCRLQNAKEPKSKQGGTAKEGVVSPLNPIFRLNSITVIHHGSGRAADGSSDGSFIFRFLLEHLNLSYR
jgi:hypothetical protein